MIEKLATEISAIASKSGKLLTIAYDKIKGLGSFAIYSTLLAYTVTSFYFGSPIKGAKVLYSEITGNKSIKHGEVEEAKFFFAKREGLKELDDEHLKNFFYELGVIPCRTNMPTDEEVRWSRLFDFNSRNARFENLCYSNAFKTLVQQQSNTNINYFFR
jgi:hypothetical protein